MTLRQKQSLFVGLIALLIIKARDLGYELTFGEVKRSLIEAERLARLGIGERNSAHLNSLAVDFNLFKDGQYMTKTEDHAVLGEYWKSLHPLCRWGGDFKNRKDGNHYSIEHNGVM